MAQMVILFCFRALLISILVKMAHKHDFNSCVTDRRTDGRTDGPTDGHTLLQRCENASKNNILRPFDGFWQQQTLGKPHTSTYADMLFRTLNDLGWCRIWFKIESCGQPQRVNQRSFRLVFHICKRRKTAMKNEASRPIFVPIPISGRRI